jgi:uncharacterized protein
MSGPFFMDLVWLCFFALIAGLIDSIAGGGGLIQLPALFLFMPSQATACAAMVLGTNKLSSICGTGLASVQYARRIPLPWKTLLPASITAFALSAMGAKVASSLSNQILKPIVLVMLVVIVIFTAFKKDLGSRHDPRLKPFWQRLWASVMGGAIGFYDGFFGPGTGSFLMLGFVGIFGFDFLTATAGSKVINLATNLAAILIFAASGNILYEVAVPMGLCNIAGALIGTRLVFLKGNAFVRRLFLLVVSALMLKMAWEIFR